MNSSKLGKFKKEEEGDKCPKEAKRPIWHMPNK
jgi:hypothetical protein